MTPKPSANAIQELANNVWAAARQRAAQTPTLPRIHQPRHRLKLIQIAYEDAAYLATLFLAGHAISRRACAEVGIKDMRRIRARALLTLADLLYAGDSVINTTDPERITKHLDTAYRAAIADPQMFFRLVPVYDKRRKDYRPKKRR